MRHLGGPGDRRTSREQSGDLHPVAHLDPGLDHRRTPQYPVDGGAPGHDRHELLVPGPGRGVGQRVRHLRPQRGLGRPAASIPAYTSGNRSMSSWRHRAMIRCGCTICGAEGRNDTAAADSTSGAGPSRSRSSTTTSCPALASSSAAKSPAALPPAMAILNALPVLRRLRPRLSLPSLLSPLSPPPPSSPPGTARGTGRHSTGIRGRGSWAECVRARTAPRISRAGLAVRRQGRRRRPAGRRRRSRLRGWRGGRPGPGGW